MNLVTALERKYKSIRSGHYERRFFDEYSGSLPEGIESAIKWRFTHRTTSEEKKVQEVIENRRKELASMEQGVDIYYSPEPNDVEDPTEPGQKTTFGPREIARTGVAAKYGLFLRRLIDGRNCSTVLELGTCAGISAAYMASGSCERLDTVEASEELANLARETIGLVHDDFEVHNALFDSYLDSLTSDNNFDFAYIDGQHERRATLHYYRRIAEYLSSGAVVVFDDIYWSNDMHECWQEIQTISDFSHTIDAGKFGVCIYDPTSERTHHIDLCEYIGRREVNDRWD